MDSLYIYASELFGATKQTIVKGKSMKTNIKSHLGDAIE
jgi:hypothetical protein